MNNKKIPDEQECFEIMNKCDMMSHIIYHSIQVKNVSMAIFDNLIDKTILSKEKIIAGALLHDIAKSKCIHDQGVDPHDCRRLPIHADRAQRPPPPCITDENQQDNDQRQRDNARHHAIRDHCC